MSDIEGRLGEVARRQGGVVTRVQARAAGLSDQAISARLRARRWQRVFVGVYATFTGPLPRAATLWVALLRAGPGAMLSHDSAAEVISLAPGSGTSPVVHVTIPQGRRIRAATPGIVVHRSRRASSIRHPSRLPPQTRVEETVLDLVEQSADLDRVFGWIARACAQRLTTAERLAGALASRERLRWRAEVVDALTDVAAGCHSLLELRYLRGVERRHALPAGVRQRARPRGGGRWYDDVCYQDYATLVELDGQAAHPAGLRWRDHRRDNAGVAEGMDVLRYGPADVTDRPCEVAAQVACVLRRNGWPGTPTPCGPHCPVGSG
jgi:very-short-patch-repair endonuclease